MNKTDWALRACREEDRELFFNEDNPQPAQAICHPCPIKQMCLSWALTQPERHGVWGGTTEDERKKLGYRKLRKRCPQCSSKHLDSSLGYAQACRKCGVSWRTEEAKTPVAA